MPDYTNQGTARRVYRLETLVGKMRDAALKGDMPQCINQPRALAQAEWIFMHLAKDPDVYLEPAALVWKALQRSLESNPEYAGEVTVRRAQGALRGAIERRRKSRELAGADPTA